MTDHKRCDQCKHMREFGGPPMLCLFGPMSRPVTYMRNPRSMCGTDGNLWEKKDELQERA